MTLADRFVAWVDEREPVTWLAAFRVAIGAIVLGVIADTWRSGALALLWLPPDAGGLGHLDADWRVAALGGPSAGVTYGLVVVVVVTASLVTAGLGTRVAALVCGQALLGLLSLAPATGGGHDRLLTNALWLLVLAPSDRSWSLGCRIRAGTWSDPSPAPAWPRRLAAWQLVVTYAITGWQKLGDEWWPWGGLEAVYRSLLMPSWARWDLAPWLGAAFPITQAMTAATIAWEGGFPVILVWWLARRRGWRFGRWPVRAALLCTGLAMHATLWAATNLGPFPFVTVAYYLALFDHADYERLLEGCQRLRRRLPGVAAGGVRRA